MLLDFERKKERITANANCSFLLHLCLTTFAIRFYSTRIASTIASPLCFLKKKKKKMKIVRTGQHFCNENDNISDDKDDAQSSDLIRSRCGDLLAVFSELDAHFDRRFCRTPERERESIKLNQTGCERYV